MGEHGNIPREARDLLEVMNSVRSSLGTGDFNALDRLLRRQEACLDQISRSGFSGHQPDVSVLDQIRAEARRNQKLLGSAQEGVRSAHRRLRQTREMLTGPKTYDRSGKVTTLGTGGKALEQRC